MAFLTYVLIIIILFILASGFRIIYQYQRAVIFTLGKFSHIQQPGLRWIIPIVQTIQKVDMRLQTVDIQKQEVITKDNVTLMVNGIVYYKVKDPKSAIIEIEDYEYAVQQFTQAALRDVIGNKELDVALTQREEIADAIKKIVDEETGAWGVDIASIKIQEIELPQEMKRAMAKQAEAERVKRAAIIEAEGELKASINLKKAADELSKSPASIQLRTLQTIRDIATNPSQKIILFLPSDIQNVVKKVLKD